MERRPIRGSFVYLVVCITAVNTAYKTGLPVTSFSMSKRIIFQLLRSERVTVNRTITEGLITFTNLSEERQLKTKSGQNDDSVDPPHRNV